jgi:hypothetical protein
VRHTPDLQNNSPVTPLPHAGSASQTLTNLAPLEDHHGPPFTVREGWKNRCAAPQKVRHTPSGLHDL